MYRIPIMLAFCKSDTFYGENELDDILQEAGFKGDIVSKELNLPRP